MTSPERTRPARLDARDLSELHALRTAHPELAPAVAMQIELVELQRRIQLRVSTPALLSLQERQGRLDRRERVLRLRDVPIEWADARLSARQTADILRRHDVIEAPDHGRLVALVREDTDLGPSVTAWYGETENGPDSPTLTPRPPMLDEVLHLALRPFFVRAVEVAERGLDLTGWQRPWCPYCGAWPDLAVYTSDDERQLICGRCSGRWQWEAVGCPWCPNRASHRLPTFTSADGRYRVCACDDCRRYLKAYNARGASRPVLPAVDTIATLPLDAAAAQRGYVGG